MVAVVSDGSNRATFHGLPTGVFFGVIHGLFVNHVVATVVGKLEVIRSRGLAGATDDAGVIDVVLAGNVIGKCL